MIESFIKAFKSNISGCRGECNCGKTFYDPAGNWDFEPGEIDYLRKDTNAVEIEHPVQYVDFNNREYVIDCDCWTPSAEKFMEQIDSYDRQIATYLNAERDRKIFEAERVKIVTILSKKDSKDEFDDDIPF